MGTLGQDTTAIFSVIENVLMEPFPYTDAQRLVSVEIHDTEQNGPGGRAAYSGPEFLDYVAQNHSLDRAIANAGLDVLYRSGEGTERFDGSYVTPGTFEFLGMPASGSRLVNKGGQINHERSHQTLDFSMDSHRLCHSDTRLYL